MASHNGMKALPAKVLKKNTEDMLALSKSQSPVTSDTSTPSSTNSEQLELKKCKLGSVVSSPKKGKSNRPRCLKMRWKILWNTCCYDIITHAEIITACYLLHNLIQREMSVDPIEAILDEYNEMQQNFTQEYHQEGYVGSMKTSDEWTNFRDNLAMECSIVGEQIYTELAARVCFS